MKQSHLIKGLTALALVAMIGISATAYADQEMGYGHHGRGMGYGPGSGYCGRGYQPDLNEEEAKKLYEEREAFFENTKNLRQKIYQKQLELRSELAKETPDAKKASSIQKEISDVKGQLDQKRIDHMIKMKKINPDVGMGGFQSRFRRHAQRGPGFRDGNY